MEGTHRKVGSRPFMPDPTLTCLCSALLGHIAKLGSITHPKQRRATILDRLLVYAPRLTLAALFIRSRSAIHPCVIPSCCDGWIPRSLLCAHRGAVY